MAFDPELVAQLAKSTETVSRLAAMADLGSEAGLNKIGIDLVGIVKRKLSQAGTGTTYYIYRAASGARVWGTAPRVGAIAHVASAPGQPPAVDLGIYRASWGFKMGHDSRGRFVEVGTGDVRGPWFEYGTSRMEPRPHLRPAVNEYRDHVRVDLVEAITAAQIAALRGLGKTLGVPGV